MMNFEIIADNSSGDVGFFQFGSSNICYGRCKIGVATDSTIAFRFDALTSVHQNGEGICLPFDFNEVVENLRQEQYTRKCQSRLEQFASSHTIRRFYYSIRNSLPFQVRRRLQRIYFKDWSQISFPAWPVDPTVDILHENLLQLWMKASGTKRLPFIWFWPNGAPNCLTITHDVETADGRDFTFDLMELDDSFGFKAAYQVVPEERYELPNDFISKIRSHGCEVNIHDLNHDGRLYAERTLFVRRAAKINEYSRRYNSQGFRAGAMYRRQEWYDRFEIKYDMSVPNVAHLEPMRGGCCSVMPYFIGKILELPLTTVQDYSLFHILNDYSIDLWIKQIALIKKQHGLISILSHPDYLIEERPRKVYQDLLKYLCQMVATEKTWVALPGEVNQWWRARNQMQLVPRGDSWAIDGPEKEKARLAFVTLRDGRLAYNLEDNG